MGKNRKLTRRERQRLTGQPRGKRRKNPAHNPGPAGTQIPKSDPFPPSAHFAIGLVTGLLAAELPAVKVGMDRFLGRVRTVEEFIKEKGPQK